MWANYAAAGVRHLLLAEALCSPVLRDRLRRAIPGARVVVCRLRARVETMQQRVRTREPGLLQEHFVGRVRELEASLDAARTDDFSVDNDARSITDVARELLSRADWL